MTASRHSRDDALKLSRQSGKGRAANRSEPCAPREVDSAAYAPNMTRDKPFHRMNMDRIAGRLLALSALGTALCAAAPARADLRMCNNTNNRVSVALAYTDGQGWVSEGWWNLEVARLRDAFARRPRGSVLLPLRDG